jgi:predicted regulator of Ras-like GTPase activity (Roadblock/LC7/MglB family)
MSARPKSPESRTVRCYFAARLAELRAAIPSVKLAMIAAEDGLLSATDADADPSPLDRRGAVLASLVAVARTSARELQLADPVCVAVQSPDGVLIVRPFGAPRRRLLLLHVADRSDASRALAAANRLVSDIEARLGSAAPTS